MKINIKHTKIYLNQSSESQEFKTDTKKTWGIMKELIGKVPQHRSTLPRKIIFNNAITDERDIEEKFFWKLVPS